MKLIHWRYNVIFSPFDWFEGGFRYVSIQNRYYSNDPEFSGTQSYKDKNFEFKVRLLEETNYLPQLALALEILLAQDFLVQNI